MGEFANIILDAGRAGVELALFVVLPIMILMLTLMRFLEAKGILDKIVSWISPLLKPFGVPGLGVFAMFQVLFVSFAAPMATLAMMDKGGSPRRMIAATLALVLGMAQANVTLPMAAFGLNAPMTMLISTICGLIGGAATYYIFARNMSDRGDENALSVSHKEIEGPKGILDIIQRAGSEALKISLNAIPMLVIALFFVALLREFGVVGLLETVFQPILAFLELPDSFIITFITKNIAGGTAVMGVVKDLLDQGLITPLEINRMAGFLISPLDIAGVAIIITAGKRVAEVMWPAVFGASIAIVLRVVAHMVIF